MDFSERSIAQLCSVSRNTVSKVLKRAQELKISWPLEDNQTNAVLQETMFPQKKSATRKPMPDFEYVHKELMRNGVTKTLLWTEYCEQCRQAGETPLMYSQYCYYIQQDEQKRRASMHIPRKPAEQVEVDWAGDPAYIIDPDTGEVTAAYIFVGVMTYSQYTYVEAFLNQKQQSWITAHTHMYDYFGGVAKILVPDNCATAVDRKGGDWYTPKLNATYQEFAEHYGCVIAPARVRKPRDKPNAEGSVKHISTWITAALRNEQFFSLSELNSAIRGKLKSFNSRLFQKKEGSRISLFLVEEKPFLAPLPATQFELTDWKQSTVQFNYHISVDKMHYSVPSEYIKKKVDVRVTGTTIEVYYNHKRIASHRRLYGREGQYSTIPEHMPRDHQKYLEWNGDRFRKWATQIGESTYEVVNGILSAAAIEQQSYKACMGLLKLADKYSNELLEHACKRALSYTPVPSYRSVKNIMAMIDTSNLDLCSSEDKPKNKYGITRGAKYYGGNNEQ